MIRFGPAGWSYKDWAGIVYPAPKPKGFDPLAYLARFFDTIEINSTFYRPATKSTAESWLRRVRGNDNFRFTAKLWRRFTHQRETAWSRADAAQASEALSVLSEGERLGAVLLQFPWSFRRNAENRKWLADLSAEFGEYPLVLEVRHSTWNHPALYESLRERGIGFVNIDQPQFSDSIAPSAHATSAVGYVRVHGRNYQDWFREGADSHERYDYLYTTDELQPWAGRTRQLAASPRTDDVYVITNNHYRGKAVANALMLRQMTTGEVQRAPPGLWPEYGDVLTGRAEPVAPG